MSNRRSLQTSIFKLECLKLPKVKREYRVLNESRIFDLEERLIEFGVRIIRLADALPKTRVGNHIAGQIIRSGTSPAPNYGEAQSAESRSDFVHKAQICLKELRETKVWLLMIAKANLIKSASQLDPLINENDQLISIFVSSVKTAKQKRREPQ
jgi:four helix bundle protein